MIVASARAVADVDSVAERLVPAPFGHALRLLRGSRAIDEAVLAAESPQVVLLGAGLDARAFRLPGLANALVFEVDHPSTQAYKRSRTSSLRLRARELRFVGVDFEADDLAERLAASGHDDATATTWIWEGVTPYLTRPAVEATLDRIARRSSPGSTLVMTYGTPDLGTVPSLLRPAVAPVFRLLGEELRGLVTPDEAHEVVCARSFRALRAPRSADAHRRARARRGPRTSALSRSEPRGSLPVPRLSGRSGTRPRAAPDAPRGPCGARPEATRGCRPCPRRT
jgi:methyltransferase (TIGR00027 family)